MTAPRNQVLVRCEIQDESHKALAAFLKSTSRQLAPEGTHCKMHTTSSQRMRTSEGNTRAAVPNTHRQTPKAWLLPSSLPERRATRMPLAPTTAHIRGYRIATRPAPPPSLNVQRPCNVRQAHRAFAGAAAPAHRPWSIPHPDHVPNSSLCSPPSSRHITTYPFPQDSPHSPTFLDLDNRVDATRRHCTHTI